MTVISDILTPINRIVTGHLGYDTPSGLGATADRGCPAKGACQGCTPFCCFNGQEVIKFVTKANIGQAGIKLATAVIPIIAGALTTTGIGVVVAAGIAVEEYLLKPISDWANLAINKSKLKDEQRILNENNLRGLSNQLQAMMQCKIAWCDVLSWLQKAPDFASNSPIFGSQGPAMGEKFMAIYLAAANEMNNARFGKTRQKIIAVMGNKSDANIDEIGLKSGILIVKVPNIEHYWMGDMVTLPGMSAPMKVMHRWGKSTFTTWDCDRVFVDQRIYPAGNHDKGRGCSLAYSFYAGGNTVSPSAGGNKEGLNIRALGGEGWLYFNIPYTTAHQAMVGGFVDLSNPIYINSQGQVTTTNTTTTPPAGSTTAGGTTPDTGTITPIKSTMASLATPLSIVILAGIGSTFIYQAIKNQQ